MGKHGGPGFTSFQSSLLYGIAWESMDVISKIICKAHYRSLSLWTLKHFLSLHEEFQLS